MLILTVVLIGCEKSDLKNVSDFKNLEFKKISQEQVKSVYIKKNKNKKVKIEDVIDGDTIIIQGGERVRYIGINTPEKEEPYFSQAKELNKKLVLGKKVKLEFDVQKRDRYGRLLAYVWTDGILVNKILVEEGLAVSETIQPNVKYQSIILQAQKDARNKCKGLWKSLCENIKNKKCIEIIRINANPKGDDNKNKNKEWIEIKNNCEYKISMDGWILKDNSSTNRYRFKNFSLNSKSSVKIYSGCGKDTIDKLYWQCPEKRYAIWNNSNDHAFLYDNKGNLVDEYEY